MPDEVEGVQQIVLTCRHHAAPPSRPASASARRAAPRVGLYEFGADDPVEPYDFGEPILDGAITAYQVTELWPDDGALHIPPVDALAIADTVLEDDGGLQFMPDVCFDDVEAERDSIRAGLARLAERLDFSHLLLAHGAPRPAPAASGCAVRRPLALDLLLEQAALIESTARATTASLRASRRARRARSFISAPGASEVAGACPAAWNRSLAPLNEALELRSFAIDRSCEVNSLFADSTCCLRSSFRSPVPPRSARGAT